MTAVSTLSSPPAALPALDTDYALSPEHAQAYRRDGHVCLRAVASADEIAAYRGAILRLVDRRAAEVPALEQRGTYGKAFLQVTNLWQEDPAVAGFTLARRFGQIAAGLLGVDRVRLYHDQALFKEPGGGPTPWHQDQGYWPLDTNQVVTMWMPLVNVSAECGSMTFASGSQANGYLGDLPISDQSEAAFGEFVAERGYTLKTHGAMRAGDATFHNGWSLHRAPGNPTDTMREVMTVIFIADGLTIAEPKNINQKNDLGLWFPGLAPGDLAAGPLNPLVYAR